MRIKWWLIIGVCFLLSGISIHAEEEEIVEVILDEYASVSQISEEDENPEAVEFLRETLIDPDKAVFDSAKEKYLITVPLSGYGITGDNVKSVVIQMLETSPELFYFENGYTFYRNTTTNAVSKVIFTLIDNPETAKKQQQEVENSVDWYMSHLEPDMSQYEIILTLHDLMASTIAYSYDDYLNNTLDAYDRNIYGAFVNQEAVCAGYAEGFMYLMNLLGIKNGYASSDAANHAWNVVELEEKWYHLDITFDDPVYNNTGKAKHEFFLISTDRLLELESQRKDYTVNTDYNVNYDDALDTRYETGRFHHETDTMIYVHQKLWTTVDREGNLVQYNPKTQQRNVIETGSFFNYSRGFGDGDSYYYTKPDGVYRLDLTTREIDKIASDSDVYGVSAHHGKLVYASGRGGTYAERIYPLNISLEHQWKKQKSTADEVVYECTECTETYTFIPEKTLKDAEVSLSEYEFTWKNKNCTPAVSVKFNGKELIENTDYTVSYKNNAQPGKAYVLIQGINEYSGSKAIDYAIAEETGDGSFENPYVTACEIVRSNHVSQMICDSELNLFENVNAIWLDFDNGEKVYSYNAQDYLFINDAFIFDEKTTDQLMGNEAFKAQNAELMMLVYTNDLKFIYVKVTDGPAYFDDIQNEYPELVYTFNQNELIMSCKVNDEACADFLDKVEDSGQATLQIFDNQTYQFIGGVYENKFERKEQTYVLNFEYFGNNIKADHTEVEIMLHNIDTYPGSASVFLDDFSMAVSSTENIIRISGKDRFKTSFAMAEQLRSTLNIEQFDAVVLASGREFADALAGSAFAAAKNAPIIMVDSKNDNLNEIKDYLNQILKPEGTVYVLGGAAAVSARAEELFSHVIRLSGKTRYETNLAILREMNVQSGTLLVASAKNFADSLSASATGLPILLVGNQLNESQIEFIKTGSWQFTILGGEAAVSQQVETTLQTYGEVERIKGKTRYETSVEIAKKYFDDPDTAVLAYGKNYPDGLSAGPLSYVLKAPLILTESKNISSAMDYTKSQSIRTGIVCGGGSLITDEAVYDVFSLLE